MLFSFLTALANTIDDFGSISSRLSDALVCVTKKLINQIIEEKNYIYFVGNDFWFKGVVWNFLD